MRKMIKRAGVVVTAVVQAQIAGAGGASVFQLDDYTHFVDVIIP